MVKPLCPHCGRRLSPKFLIQARNSLIKGAGRKPVLKPCQWCGEQLGYKARRRHEVRCPKNPRNA